MANLDNIVDETKVVTEDSENPFTGSGSNAEEIRVTLPEVQKVVAKGAVETEIVLESLFEDNYGLGLTNTAKEIVESLSSAGDGTMNVSDGTVEGVLKRDVEIDNGKASHLNNEDGKSKKSDEIGRNCTNVEASGNGRWNGEKLEDGDHGFRVGDLVWGKVRSTWWPGQIYDPRNASEFAVKHSLEGRLLVAFFGDGSCSWCLPWQLVPFIENFDQMSKDGTSKSVVNAIQKAVDEVGRIAESRLTCKCIQLEKRGHLARPVVANAGLKEGVVVPELDIDQLLVPEYGPNEILAKVSNLAKVGCVDNALDLGILRSWLSALNNAKCGYPLVVYKEPVYIEGLEDNNDSEMQQSLSVEVPVNGPQDDSNYSGNKQRSVAELMQKRNDSEPERKKKSLKRHKSVDGEVENALSSTQKAGSQKRRTQADSEEKLKKIDGKEEVEIATSPRERKKSKYLSPPYTNLDWKIWNSSFKMKSESDKIIMRSSSPVDETSDGSHSMNALVVNNGKGLSFSESNINIPVNELLSEVEFAAVDPFFLRNNGCLDKVGAFVSAFRGSTYVHGADYRVYQKSIGNECDELLTDVSLIREKLDIMTGMLEDYCCKISSEEKCRLKDEMKNLMEYVETASRKVRLVAQNAE